MTFFDAYLVQLLAALVTAAAVFAIAVGVVPVGRVVRAVRVVRPAPSRARRR